MVTRSADMEFRGGFTSCVCNTNSVTVDWMDSTCLEDFGHGCDGQSSDVVLHVLVEATAFGCNFGCNMLHACELEMQAATATDETCWLREHKSIGFDGGDTNGAD